MALTREHHEAARQIDAHVRQTLARENGDEELLLCLYDHMPAFKQILDAVAPGEMDALCEQSDGFYHFGKVLERIAQGIAEGDINVPDEPI